MSDRPFDSYYQFHELTQKFKVRQFEYHPTEDILVFGTLKGNVCAIDLGKSDNPISFLGNHGGITSRCILFKTNKYFIINESIISTF
jgi:hypothetical protein